MMDDETIDEILEGSLKIRQSRRGYRFNMDSLILASFVSLKSRCVNMDLGCGNGVIALVLAKRYPSTKWTGLEIQDGLALLAGKNAEQNHLEKRITIVKGDAREVKRIFSANFCDNVVFNPPYRKLFSGRINPGAEKAIARHEIKGSLADFLGAASYLLKPQGHVFTIYPSTRLVDLISLFRKNNIEPKRMKPVFSDKATSAEFVLVEGRKGGREELKMEPPLFIYDEPQKYSADMIKIFSDLAFSPALGGD
jgi:tRNA1Val (adenine37-N6)-methyltransferase